MERKIGVTKLERSLEGTQYLDKMSYRVSISEGDKNIVFEARITLGTLETLSEPEKHIEACFRKGPLPKANTVIDL